MSNESLNPAYNEAKKYLGKSESDSRFSAWLSKFWAKLGIGYHTITGSDHAWCGLFISAMNAEVGQKSVKGAAGARNWDNYGQAIDWKKDGIPRGAVLRLNHKFNPHLGSSNHVTFADGDYSAHDLAKSGFYVGCVGGNQGNRVRRSMYSVREICQVRWPSELAKPAPIVKTLDGGSTTVTQGESTR